MTESYEQYIALAQGSGFSECWYAHTSNILSDYTFDFAEEDWLSLAKQVHMFSNGSQEKCLYTIGEAAPQHVFKIAMSLLDSDNNCVADQALSTINECFDHVKVDRLDIAFLKAIEERLSDRLITQKIYQVLKKKIENRDEKMD